MVLGSDHSRGTWLAHNTLSPNKMDSVDLRHQKVLALERAANAWKEARDEEKYYASLKFPNASLEELRSQQHIVKNLMQRAEIYQDIANQIDLEAE